MAIQEGPSLCAQKLAADLEKSADWSHELTTEDLRAYADARSRRKHDALKCERAAPGAQASGAGLSVPVALRATLTFLQHSISCWTIPTCYDESEVLICQRCSLTGKLSADFPSDNSE